MMKGERELRAALRETLTGLRNQVPAEMPFSRLGLRDGGQCDYLHQMITKALEEVSHWPVDKLGRWIGFIQGVLFEANAISLKEERDRTRPLFHEAYKEMGLDIPVSWEGS